MEDDVTSIIQEVSKIRCNDCMNIMTEDEYHTIIKCAKCGRDDCLTNNFKEVKK